MYLRWEGDRPLADRELLAKIYEVSERTIRRHCTPALREPRTGRPRGEGGRVLYDAYAAATALADVAPRPARTLRALRAMHALGEE
jgi:hypothetical protein